MKTKTSKTGRKNTMSKESKEVTAAKQKKLDDMPSAGTWERENIPDLPAK